MDPMGYAAGDVDLYRFEFNSPQGYLDSLGLEPEKIPLPLPDWGEKETSKGHCYRYAVGSKNDSTKKPNAHSINPGDADWLGIIIFADVKEAAMTDGLIAPIFVSVIPLIGYVSTRVAYVVEKPTKGQKTNDYHWYREMPGGMWTHKRSRKAVESVDAEGKGIKSPESAAMTYKYYSTVDGKKVILTMEYQFGGYLYVPPGLKLPHHSDE